ncbi:signal peptidase II [bacterium]|jgi:signal peptidase II|nr:signal peptidase II [bacterium]
MKKLNALFGYGFLGGLVILVDQLTKWLALTKVAEPFKFNQFVSFNVCFNRGISWGMLNSDSTNVFVIVTFLIFLVCCGFAWHAYNQFKNEKSVVLETLIISGAISNIIDRFVYSGVVDFIVLSYNGWAWPTFNIADAVIVFGVFSLLFVETFGRQK